MVIRSSAAAGQSAPLRPGRFGDLQIRFASAVVLVALALGAAWLGGVVFAVFWLAVAAAAGWEWQRLIGTARLAPRVLVSCLGLLAVAAVTASCAAMARSSGFGLAAIGGPLVAGAALEAALAGPGRRLWAAAGFAYAGSFLAAALALRGSAPNGLPAIIWLFAVVWSTDVFAYVGGRLIGGPRLWPRVSPSKTWSGTLTGIVTGGVVGTLLVAGELDAPIRLPIFLLSVATAALAQGGDLFESALKRRFGVKDSGGLIPGHGGVLDRVDGFVVAVVFACLVGIAREPPSIAAGLFQWG